MGQEYNWWRAAPQAADAAADAAFENDAVGLWKHDTVIFYVFF